MIIDSPNYASPAGEMIPRPIAHATDLIIHHTAGPAVQSALDIDAEHRQRGFAMIGYNWVIEHDGRVCKGRPMDVVPAAAYGRNSQSIDIALTGNFQPDDAGFTGDPTAEQIQALKELSLKLHHDIPSIVRTIGHRDVAGLFYNGDGDYATACPGDRLYAQLPEVRTFVQSSMPRL